MSKGDDALQFVYGDTWFFSRHLYAVLALAETKHNGNLHFQVCSMFICIIVYEDDFTIQQLIALSGSHELKHLAIYPDR